jgi:hypothetical protein
MNISNSLVLQNNGANDTTITANAAVGVNVLDLSSFPGAVQRAV